MNYLIAIPIIIAGVAGIWWLSKKLPKGVLIIVGIILNLIGRYMSTEFSMTFLPSGERLDSGLHKLIADVGLPLQLLGVIAVIHGIAILFRKKKTTANQRLDPIVPSPAQIISERNSETIQTPIESGNEQGTAGRP